LEQGKLQLAELISQEVGKPLWESLTEVGAMIGKIAISVKAFEDRCGTRQSPLGDARSVTRFKPHGVVAIFGPFNFPGHLPNGHIVPALLAGNTIVFKPSELTPAVGQRMVELLSDSGLPAGVINLVQGARDTGIALAAEADLDGIFFTGSSSAGKAIHQSYGGRPEKILALEMGGNNPLIVHDIDDLDAAVYWTIQSSFITAGQRCVCARRLILTESANNQQYLEKLLEHMPRIQIGHYKDQPEPFMGPVVSTAAADRILSEQSELISKGGTALRAVERSDRSAALLSPGIMDVTSVNGIRDEEIFGPLLQLIRVADLNAAIDEANRTVYGLAAAIFCRRQADFDEFFRRSRAGIVNWNKPTTGASSAAPFGGIGQSGNHNPSAYFAADYCSYPIASVESDALKMPSSPTPGLE
jgi:succinylglutamic semialdehyde dehydrogenase